MSNEKKNFAIQTSPEECSRAMNILEKMDGSTNAQKLTTMLDTVTSVLERDGLSVGYKSHLQSIDASLANIKTNIIAIAKSAAEELKHGTAELQERIESQVKTIQSLQRENETMTTRLAEAEENKKVAEAAAEDAKEQASQLAKQRDFYEAAARDKEDLNNLLRDKVATLQEDVLSSEEKMDSLQKENDALRAEVESLKRENAELQRAQEAKTANLDSIIAELNDPPV